MGGRSARSRSTVSQVAFHGKLDVCNHLQQYGQVLHRQAGSRTGLDRIHRDNSSRRSECEHHVAPSVWRCHLARRLLREDGEASPMAMLKTWKRFSIV